MSKNPELDEKFKEIKARYPFLNIEAVKKASKSEYEKLKKQIPELADIEWSLIVENWYREYRKKRAFGELMKRRWS